MTPIQKFSKRLTQIYIGIGAAAMGLLALLVIFTVIARYCFSHSWKSLAEFNVTLFAFTTFWALGINVILDEHVSINILYDKLKPAVKRFASILSGLISLTTVSLFAWYAYNYTLKMGKQISQGMEVPMYFMYGIMPVCGALCALCLLIKIILYIKAPLSFFEAKTGAVENPDERSDA